MTTTISFLSKWPIDFERKLGSGRYGIVYKVANSDEYAIKCMKLSTYDLSWFYREIELLTNSGYGSRHLNYCVDWHFCEENLLAFVVMPMAKGDLYTYIFKHKHFFEMNPEDVIFYWSQIVIGVSELHNKYKLVHGDLKPENILLFENKDTNGLDLYLTDFGFIRSITTPKVLRYGSVYYSAPECFKSGKQFLDNSGSDKSGSDKSVYNRESADVWALGLILWNMLMCSHPWDYDDSKDIFEKRLIVPHFFPKWIRVLLRRMLCKHPKDRIGVNGILLHLRRNRVLLR